MVLMMPTRGWCTLQISLLFKAIYGKFSLRLIRSARFGATFNLVTRVRVP